MLWRIEREKFRVVEYHEVTAPLLTNVDYILINKRFKAPIDKMVGQVQTHDVVIYDKVRNLTWDNYFEVKIVNDISPDTINLLDATGLKIWNYGNMAVFVSEELKTAIEKIDPNEFQFSEGFSCFAG